MSTSPQPQAHVIDYTVDGQPQQTTQHLMTPREIIRNAGLNPDERYLVEIRGKEQISYRDRMDEPIRLHENQKFVTVFTGPVPVA